MRIARMLAISIVASPVLGQGAAAQDWQQKRQRPQNPPQAQPVPQQVAPGGACVASGFARLTRNCSINTGGCQRLPDNCNRGWCCP